LSEPNYRLVVIDATHGAGASWRVYRQDDPVPVAEKEMNARDAIRIGMNFTRAGIGLMTNERRRKTKRRVAQDEPRPNAKSRED
tara:strand:- start:56 stop:307 length:252 start_codon:yes stop_codon:yes gene_type:complete